MKIAVIENLRENAPSSIQYAADEWEELGTRELVDTIVDALCKCGYTAAFFEGDISLVRTLPDYNPDICLNISEGWYGEGRECHVPSLLEMLCLDYIGSGIPTLALTLDKARTNQLLDYHGLRTPSHQLFYDGTEKLDKSLIFPLIVKPCYEGSSKGIDLGSVVQTEKELRERVEWVIISYNQAAMVETFIKGREITIGILGNADRVVDMDADLFALPPFEILFERPEHIYTLQIKSQSRELWAQGREYNCPAVIELELLREMEQMAKHAFVVTGCKDYARFDFRLDSNNNKPYLIETNALPGLFRNWSDMAFEATAIGWKYEELIKRIVEIACSRLAIN